MSNHIPTISVLMSVYNEQESWLREAIESILNQTYTDFEFIIILDNPNNTMAKRVIIEYKNNDKRIIFLENKENIGTALSKNRGLEAAKGKYIAIMDDDDISLPERFVKQIEFMKNNAEIDLIGSSFYIINEYGNIIGSEIYSNNPVLLKKLTKYRNPAHHPTWLVKKIIYNKLRGYNYLRAGVEDFDFILRALENNFLISNVKDPLFKYRIREGQISQQKSLIQLKTTLYIINLHKQRLKTGKDNFSQENLIKATRSSKLTTYLYHKADKFYLKARELKDKKRLINASFLVIVSFILSPYWMSKRIYRAFFGLEKVQSIYLKYLNKKTKPYSLKK